LYSLHKADRVTITGGSGNFGIVLGIYFGQLMIEFAWRDASMLDIWVAYENRQQQCK
jgi:hypothetical protein